MILDILAHMIAALVNILMFVLVYDSGRNVWRWNVAKLDLTVYAILWAMFVNWMYF